MSSLYSLPAWQTRSGFLALSVDALFCQVLSIVLIVDLQVVVDFFVQKKNVGDKAMRRARLHFYPTQREFRQDLPK